MDRNDQRIYQKLGDNLPALVLLCSAAMKKATMTVNDQEKKMDNDQVSSLYHRSGQC